MAVNWRWDDVRFFLAAAREGSLSGAAKALGVDHRIISPRKLCDHVFAQLENPTTR